MPAIFAHYLLLDKVKQRFQGTEVEQVLTAYSPHAHLGAFGPDLLFFYLKDWPGGKTVLTQTFACYETIQDTIQITRDLKTRTPAILQDFTLFDGIRQAIDLLCATVTALSLDLAAANDWFELAKPKMHDDYEKVGDFSWIDLLHHRHSGDFLRSLWARSAGNPSLRSYAIGYLTHMAGDVIGHAHVNRLVGGPYRHHWRRHVFIEKILDSRMWHEENGGWVESSELYKRVAFGPSDDEPVTPLPVELADMISASLADAYAGYGSASGVPDPGDLRTMYTLFYKWVKHVSGSDLEPPERPPGPLRLIGELAEILNQAREVVLPWNVAVPTSAEELKNQMRRCVEGVRDLAARIPEFCRRLVELAHDIDGLNLALWLIRKSLYEMYVLATYVLAMAGYIHPFRRHFDYGIGTFAQPTFPTPSSPVYYPAGDGMYSGYPQRRPSDLDPAWSKARPLQVYHLFHPANLAASPGANTEVFRTTPFVHAELDYSFRDTLLARVGTAEHYEWFFQRYPTATEYEGQAFERRGSLFSAADLAEVALRKAAVTPELTFLPNWNLDSDRGFAWPDWRYDGAWPPADPSKYVTHPAPPQ